MENELPLDCTYNMRTFGFTVANNTALLSEKINDLGLISECPNALGNIFAIEIFGSYDKTGNYLEKGRPFIKSKSNAMADYVTRLENNLPVNDIIDLLPSGWQTVQDWRGAMFRFLRDLGNEALETEALINVTKDYGDYDDEASRFELVCATFCNIIRMDTDWTVTNETWVRERVSQLVRLQHDNTYEAQPEFSDDETALWW